MASFGERVVGAMSLKASTFQEIEHDTTAMGQAVGVIALAAVSTGLGNVWYGGVSGILTGSSSSYCFTDRSFGIDFIPGFGPDRPKLHVGEQLPHRSITLDIVAKRADGSNVRAVLSVRAETKIHPIEIAVARHARQQRDEQLNGAAVELDG